MQAHSSAVRSLIYSNSEQFLLTSDDTGTISVSGAPPSLLPPQRRAACHTRARSGGRGNAVMTWCPWLAARRCGAPSATTTWSPCSSCSLTRSRAGASPWRPPTASLPRPRTTPPSRWAGRPSPPRLPGHASHDASQRPHRRVRPSFSAGRLFLVHLCRCTTLSRAASTCPCSVRARAARSGWPGAALTSCWCWAGPRRNKSGLWMRVAGHGGDVRWVEWHPSQGLLASGSKDALVKLWDPRAGAMALATMHGHKNGLMQVRGPGPRGAGGEAPACMMRRFNVDELPCARVVHAGAVEPSQRPLAAHVLAGPDRQGARAQC